MWRRERVKVGVLDPSNNTALRCTHSLSEAAAADYVHITPHHSALTASIELMLEESAERDAADEEQE